MSMLTPASRTAEELLDSLEPDNVDAYTVAVGNPFAGTQLHGVFESWEEAADYAQRMDEWHIVPIWKA